MRSIVAILKPLVWCWMMLNLLSAPIYAAEKPDGGNSNAQVMEAFNQANAERGKYQISNARKQQVMFIMGITLLAFIVTTVSLGVAMVVFAKPVFVAHMIFAGFSLTLAIAHAIVAIVWFFPA